MKIPIIFSGNKNNNKNNNKTQIIILELLKYLSKENYYYFINNLFILEYFLEFLHIKSYNTTRICQTNAGMIFKLIILKKRNKKKILTGDFSGNINKIRKNNLNKIKK
jgi:hypothetical protein